ncbi:hypothetical protein Enr17x_04480 [Gimesia fumaroli]|uniref:Uncharacterized protein n=1 Tax=Gimesia fumaroli TaxID=2527976 RepID=A0A518I5Q8_9PLAN|nr:hypothetical protein Enr17x_04480 [Gimesia fumaroli]
MPNFNSARKSNAEQVLEPPKFQHLLWMGHQQKKTKKNALNTLAYKISPFSGKQIDKLTPPFIIKLITNQYST